MLANPIHYRGKSKQNSFRSCQHLARMTLFKVNTGTREKEVYNLLWEWEVAVPELDTSLFIILGERVKNGDEGLVVLNRVARSVIEKVRGEHPSIYSHSAVTRSQQ